MFSSIANFLPSALHIGQSDSQPAPHFRQDDPASEEEHEGYHEPRVQQQQGQPQLTAKAREKTANESFIIVRPPPSKSNHPLNLQVQLVPPNIKPPNGLVSQSNTSVPTAASDSSHTLARTPSTRSDASYSNYGSSTASFSSVASSSTSTRRTIVPLYSLQAHNVMPNIIVDAGTDAKIAKFGKRGIVLIDLASLEPVEVWGDPSSTGRTSTTDDPQGANFRSSMFSTRSVAESSRAHTPERHLTAASSAISLNSAKQSQSNPQHQNSLPRQSQHQSPLPPPIPPKELAFPFPASETHAQVSSTPHPSSTSIPAKRNIFGKLFQSNPGKKSSSPSTALPTISTASPPVTISPPSQDSDLTPKAPSQQPPTVASVTPGSNSKEGGHGRNLSLTAFASPIKTTFKNNKNKLASVIQGTHSSSSLNVTSAHPEALGPGLRIGTRGTEDANGEKGAMSPSKSASSLAITLESADSGIVPYGTPTAGTPGAGAGNMSVQPPSHLHPPSHVHYPSGCSVASASASPQSQLQQLQSRPPVLDIQSTYVSTLGGNLSGLSDVKKMRALMYVWLIRRWLKPIQEERGIRLPSVTGGGGFLGLGSKNKDKDQNDNTAQAGAGVEVRFEWKRAKAKGSGGRGRGRAGKEKSESEGKKARKSFGIERREGEEGARTEREKSRDSKRRRKSDTQSLSGRSARSTQSLRSLRDEPGSEGSAEAAMASGGRTPRRRNATFDGVSLEGGDGDRDGEESDPEDSETPWVCTLKVRRTPRTSVSSANNGNAPNVNLPLFLPRSGEKQDVLRVKVGTLSPTPHHPKVVAMLKVPFPLPDVEVERLSIRRRVPGSAPGQGGAGEFGEVKPPHARDYARADREVTDEESDEYKGLVLTAEEIKDILCSTALWLIVREGIGGVGRVNRKGDGWRIRH